MMKWVWFLAFMSIGGWSAAALLAGLWLMSMVENLRLRFRVRQPCLAARRAAPLDNGRTWLS